MRSVLLILIFLVQITQGRAAGPVTPSYARPGSSNTAHRTWTSLEGRELLAELVEVMKEEVVLLTPEKKSFTVPISTLSSTDRTFIADWLKNRSVGIGFFETGIFSGEGLPEEAHVNGVEHVVQRESYCATASAEMILGFYGLEYDQKLIARISSEDSRRGSGTGRRELSVALRNLGMDVAVLRLHNRNPKETPFNNLLNGIKHAIANNRPVGMSYRTSTSSHMVVVVGYDDRRHLLYLLDPAGVSAKPSRVRYKMFEEVIHGAMVPFPRPNTGAPHEEADPPDARFLDRISKLIRGRKSLHTYGTTLTLREAGIEAVMRDVNRLDARSSQGLTRSFARKFGVTFVQRALDQGNVVLAPQSFDSGNGLSLIYAHDDHVFYGVEYFPNGTFRRGEISLLDFSLRWMVEKDHMYLLYIVEITPPAEG